MFCKKTNRSLGKDYTPLIKRLTEVGFLEKIIQIYSDKEAGGLLLKLRDEFRNSSDIKNKKKQAVLIWAFREYLGKEIIL